MERPFASTARRRLGLATLALVLAVTGLAACGRAEDGGRHPRDVGAPAPPEGVEPVSTRGPEEVPGSGTPAARNTPAMVQVFYATDRARHDPGLLDHAAQLRWPLAVLFLGWMLLRTLRRLFRPEARRVLVALRIVLVSAVVVLAIDGAWTILSVAQAQARLNVLYGDARRVTRRGGDLTDVLELGVAEVSIPPGHVLGEVERPSPWRGDLFEDPQRHMVVFDVQTKGERVFFEALDRTILASPDKDAFVFVHGYNVSFQEALLRTAQIAHDLEFEGAPICYSWPSQADVAQYFVDEANVGWTVPHLRRFLLALKGKTQAERIHLVAHSMGNRALTDVLARLALERRDDPPLFHEVVLAAPDIDAETFREHIAPAILPAGRRVTLYASSKDKALLVSSSLHGSARAGESGPAVVLVDGMDTVDVSEVSGSHSYIGNNERVLGDLGGVLLHGRRLVEGPGVAADWIGDLRCWILRRLLR